MIELRKIDELRGLAFRVPTYQRGYRWTWRQVEDLLNDLTDFGKHNTAGGNAFYCLQPVIVKQRPTGEWELIDGQQRLTTLYIILHFLNTEVFKEATSLFTLAYDTRPTSADFLQDIDESRKDENIDFYHICEAKKCIRAWFENQTNRNREGSRLHDVIVEQTKVIWYDILNGPDPHDIFIRINSGKIPLTNAELIKALFRV